MYRLLTLAIAETKIDKDEFKVVTYDLDARRIISLDLSEKEIRPLDGKVNWDLFAITEVENITDTNDSDIYIPGGVKGVKDYYGKEDMKRFFRRNKMSIKDFSTSNINYGIGMIELVKDISFKSNDGIIEKTYIKLNADEYPGKLLIKDEKWLSYWKTVKEEENLDKKELWIKYLNDINKQIYVVLYRRNFSGGGSSWWIAGFHCL